MIGCLSLGRETFDVNFANENINLVEKRLIKSFLKITICLSTLALFYQ